MLNFYEYFLHYNIHYKACGFCSSIHVYQLYTLLCVVLLLNLSNLRVLMSVGSSISPAAFVTRQSLDLHVFHLNFSFDAAPRAANLEWGMGNFLR